jgi:hypothetical protein
MCMVSVRLSSRALTTAPRPFPGDCSILIEFNVRAGAGGICEALAAPHFKSSGIREVGLVVSTPVKGEPSWDF